MQLQADGTPQHHAAQHATARRSTAVEGQWKGSGNARAVATQAAATHASALDLVPEVNSLRASMPSAFGINPETVYSRMSPLCAGHSVVSHCLDWSCATQVPAGIGKAQVAKGQWPRGSGNAVTRTRCFGRTCRSYSATLFSSHSRASRSGGGGRSELCPLNRGAKNAPPAVVQTRKHWAAVSGRERRAGAPELEGVGATHRASSRG